MTIKTILPKLLPHAIAVILFIGLSWLYFSPLFSDYNLKQSDIKQYQGAAKEISDYRMMNDKEALWTNGMFSGMPAYQISVNHTSNLMAQMTEILRLGLPAPAGILFVSMLGFYILGLCLRVSPWVAIMGGIAFGFATFNVLYIGAGHLTKVNAVSYMAPTLGGLLLATRGKWLFGSIVFALFLSLNVSSNHLQMTYYLMILIGVVAVSEGIRLLFEKEVKTLIRVVPALVLAGFLAFLPTMSNLLTTYEYANYTTRGKSDLTITPEGKPREKAGISGLTKEYILQYNFGKGEFLSLFIPDAKGGKAGSIAEDEDVMENVDPRFAETFQTSVSHYWGEQEFSGGAIYIGAVVVMLFLLGLLFVKDSLKWPVIVLTILAISLAAKDGALSNYFIDHFPAYNKFRDSKMILVILMVVGPMMAMLFVDNLSKNERLLGTRKMHLIGLGSVVVLALALFIIPSLSGDFLTKNEKKQFKTMASQAKDPADAASYMQLKNEIQDARVIVYKKDAGRTFLFFLLTGGVVLLAFYRKGNPYIWVASLGLLITVDQYNVCRRYLTDDIESESYEEKISSELAYNYANADLSILEIENKMVPNFNKKLQEVEAKMQDENLFENQEDPQTFKTLAAFTALNLNSNYRVLNFNNPIAETRTSYYHKSIGGYHGAKLKRYQDLVDFYIQKELSTLQNALISAAVNSDTTGQLVSQANQLKDPQERSNFFSQLLSTQDLSKLRVDTKLPILNMLNTKYFISSPSTPAIQNNQANGNAWFVSSVKKAKSANEEIKLLGTLDTKKVAVSSDKEAVALAASYKMDANSRVSLNRYATNELNYTSKNSSDGVIVFSEIYYPDGWNCYIDGKKTAYFRVNYLLRGVKVAAGNHKIDWKFEPNSYLTGSTYSFAGSIILLLAFFGVGGMELKKSLKEEEAK
ncbi:MAG: hypothetical protein K9I37_10655 [Crocinitomicaceae bacterium]|nr:hypothetical protein [Crocinitomicaceae bacterium]